jgi:glycosyltransferase involved in cell wall biosynthesis
VAERIIISVTSDLVTDQRVQRTAGTLKEVGYQVMLVGRVLPDSIEMKGKRFRIKRFKLWFNKGPLFYMNYNIRLFWYLLFHQTDILLSNDLDTLPANYLISKIKRIPLVYDSHEYFTGVPELSHRPRVRAIWKRIESYIVPQLKYAYTVNSSIAKLYKEEYNVTFKVIQNMPELKFQIRTDLDIIKRELRLPQDKSIIILQGAGINIQRGAEEAVQAMQFVEDAILLIIGSGDVIPALKLMAVELQLTEKVKFEPKKSPSELFLYTLCADIGLSLDKDTNLNYRFSLPNKIFDYIQAGVPILASDLPEVKKIVEGYDIGYITPDHQIKNIANLMNKMILEKEKRLIWQKNLKAASQVLNWNQEKNKLLSIFRSIGE